MTIFGRRTAAPETESLRAQLGELQRDVEYLTGALDEARAAYQATSGSLLAKTAEFDATERDLRRRLNEALRALGDDTVPTPAVPVDGRPDWTIRAENDSLRKERDRLRRNCAVLEQRARAAEARDTVVRLGAP